MREIATSLWGDLKGDQEIDKKVGKGQIIYGRTLQSILQSNGINPDFEVAASDSSTFIDFIHRTSSDAEIYFLANRNNRTERIKGLFRIQGREPELWNPVNGERYKLPEFERKNHRTEVPLEFSPYESMFIVFPKNASKGLIKKTKNFNSLESIYELSGSWDVQFEKK